MNRQGIDWTPLVDSDPLPGDPQAIFDEAVRLRRLGFQMRDQIANLRRIADTHDLVGKSVDALRASAGEIVVGLEKVVARHEKTADILSRWHGELTRLQDATRAPLDVAVEANRLRIRAETERAMAIPVGLAGAGPGAMYDHQVAVARADELLGQARKALQDILEEHERLDRDFARLIDDATNDDAEDGRWDNFKDWVGRNKAWMDDLTKVLGLVATTAAIVAVTASGAGAVALVAGAVAMSTTAGSAATHGALAAAGEGSKFDLALDIFALATFGTGRALTAALKAKQVAARGAGVNAARQSAYDASLATNQAVRDAATRVLNDPNATAWAKVEAKFTLRHTLRSAERAGANAAEGVKNLPMPAVTKLEKQLSGNIHDPRNIKDIRNIESRFPQDTEVYQAARGAGELLIAGRVAYLSGTTADFTDKFLDDKQHWDPYLRFKGRFTREMGSAW